MMQKRVFLLQSHSCRHLTSNKIHSFVPPGFPMQADDKSHKSVQGFCIECYEAYHQQIRPRNFPTNFVCAQTRREAHSWVGMIPIKLF